MKKIIILMPCLFCMGFLGTCNRTFELTDISLSESFQRVRPNSPSWIVFDVLGHPNKKVLVVRLAGAQQWVLAYQGRIETCDFTKQKDPIDVLSCKRAKMYEKSKKQVFELTNCVDSNVFLNVDMVFKEYKACTCVIIDNNCRTSIYFRDPDSKENIDIVTSLAIGEISFSFENHTFKGVKGPLTLNEN